MQIKLFTISIGDSRTALKEMNRFLKGNKILEVQNQYMVRLIIGLFVTCSKAGAPSPTCARQD